MVASPSTPGTPKSSKLAASVAVVLSLWLALVFFYGAHGAFVNPPGTPPLPILIGFLIPVIAFVAAYVGIGRFRDFMLSLDPRLVAGIQAWRFAGFGFIALTMHGILPGPFAWRAGLGDMFIGATAPWVILALVRDPGFVRRPLFVLWNLLGILDLFVAMGSAALSAIQVSGGGEASTAPMAQMPLVLIPAYLVPMFFLLHLISLFQSRR